MERLSGLDASFLYNETPVLHMHTLKFTVLDMSGVTGGYDFERFRDELRRRLHLLPPFRRRIVEVPLGLHHPVWIEDPAFDIDDHLRRVVVPPPAGRREIDETIATIASTALDRSRPLWEIWMLEGLAGERVGFVAKIHHAVADGIAAAALLANVMTSTPEEVDPSPPPAHWRAETIPSRWRLVREALTDLGRDALRLPGLIRRTVAHLRALRRQRREAAVATPRPILDAARTPFNAALTARRSFAAATLALGDVKVVKDSFGVTVNDVVLAIVAGALRNWLLDRDALPEKPLIAGVPVTTDDPGTTRLGGNKVSNMFTSLRTDLADPVERLHAIHEVTAAAKVAHGILGARMLADWSEYTPPRPYAAAMRLYGRLRLADHHRPPINLVVSNVPGPREPLYVAGGRMEGIHSVGPILEGVGMNVTVWSYCDQLDVGVLACRDQVAEPHEITEAMASALVELTERAGVLRG